MIWKDKVAVVTGGAHGIGRCICQEFEKEGARVCVIDLLENPFFQGDLADKETLERFAAKVIGESDFQILLRHLVPNSMGPIIVTVTFLIPQAIFYEAFLSFIGIGISVPVASWGTLANDSLANMNLYPHLMLFPAVAISITMFALNFIGDGLRDALDPRLKK